MRGPGTALAFEWDDTNEDHLAEHGLLPHEVEEVFMNGATFRKNRRSAVGAWLMRGRTDAGRGLCVAVLWSDEEAGILRAITGWPISVDQIGGSR